MSREELALTREELAKTKEETALSRRAMEAQVKHLEHEAKINEINNVLKAQAEIINNLLTTHLLNADGQSTNFEQVLNCSPLTEKYINSYQDGFQKPHNSVNIVGKALEIQLIQLATISLAYEEISNSSLYSLPYLTNATTLLGKFHKFHNSAAIEGLLKTLHERISAGGKQI